MSVQSKYSLLLLTIICLVILYGVSNASTGSGVPQWAATQQTAPEF